jgi:RNA recognition motif-containing protein
MNIYVGNLAREVTEEDLRKSFEAYGEVTSAKIITDKFTGSSRGFGFVEMPKSPEAQAAIHGLDGTDLKGNALKVNEARPRQDRGRGGFNRGGFDRNGPGRKRRF